MPATLLIDTSFRRHPAAIFVVTLVGFASLAMYFLFCQTSIPEITPVSQQGRLTLLSGWAKGEMVVLIRHAERCDRVNTPCLDAKEGISVSGRELAVTIGQVFDKFGLDSADVLTSPLLRTRQTAAAMFRASAVEQEWLANCKTITVEDVIRRKAVGRNLILVTHNHCIEKIAKDAKVDAFRDLGYGSLLFMAVDGQRRTLNVAAALDADQFIVSFRSAM